MRGLAGIATRYGSGQVRLTVWQNFLIPNIKADDMPAVQNELADLELDWRASSFHAGLVACTGNAGCKFAASDTKRHSLVLADYLRESFQLDQPINIHLTGCHHSCAQHAIGDIGLIATKVLVGEEMVEGYHILVGGRTGSQARIGQTLFESVPFEDVPARVAATIAHYLQHREPHMSFADFAIGHDWQLLKSETALGIGEHA
jgi:ferredoxin-nitrite reductase